MEKTIALVILSSLVASGQLKKHDVVCPSMDSDPVGHAQIIGGVEAGIGEFPWMVSIRDVEGPYCGGSLITPEIVLTAAYCYPFVSARIYLGSHNLSESGPNEVIREIKNVTLHPDHMFYGEPNDIAIILLDKPVELNRYVNTICIPPSLANTTGMATVAGWGDTNFVGYPSDVLMKVDVPVLSDYDCRYKTNYLPSDIDDKVICAGYLEGGKDTCQGDNGGPLVKRLTDGSYYLAGIVSWGHGCAWVGYPWIYTEISYFTQWIQDEIEKLAP